MRVTSPPRPALQRESERQPRRGLASWRGLAGDMSLGARGSVVKAPMGSAQRRCTSIICFVYWLLNFVRYILRICCDVFKLNVCNVIQARRWAVRRRWRGGCGSCGNRGEAA